MSIIRFKSILILPLFFLILSTRLEAQVKGRILVVANVSVSVHLDGESIGTIEANKPMKFDVTIGEHYLQIISVTTKEEKSEIIDIEEDKQIVLKYEFGLKESPKETVEKILVADVDFNIPGLIMAESEENFEYPVYYYAFEKGDKVIINLDMSNKRGTNVIEVFTYPGGNTIYSNDDFKDLKDHNILINEKSIYGFAFATKHILDRDVRLTVERIPSSDEARDFNTSVVWKEEYEVLTIQEAQNFYINGNLNAAFSNGKTKLELPVTLPENTVKWFYEFSAFRDEEKLESISSSFNLAADLAKLIDKTGILGFGIEQLGKPPGSEYCDIYLLDYEELNSFMSDMEFSYFIEGTRKNYESGVVEVNCCLDSPLYLGISNSTITHGIHVVIEVAAITKKEGWVMSSEVQE